MNTPARCSTMLVRVLQGGMALALLTPGVLANPIIPAEHNHAESYLLTDDGAAQRAKLRADDPAGSWPQTDPRQSPASGSFGTISDCNSNAIPDAMDIAAGTSVDCQPNLVPDECEIAAGPSADCNANNIPDACDLASGASGDCDNDGVPNECEEPANPGCNAVDLAIPLTAHQPVYWSAATGAPANGGLTPFPVLDPIGANGCPGRPAQDGTTERVLRGFLVAWAVSHTGEEIRWNHLAGDVTIVNYATGAAWEYTAYAFQAVNPAVAHGEMTGTPGSLFLNGSEYDRGYDLLLIDFLAAGSSAYAQDGNPVLSDTDLTLMPLDLDLRQESDGPVTTKATFTIWNANEVKFTGLDRCITCWDQTLVSLYPAPNHFLVENLQTDRGKAQVNGLASALCDRDFVIGDGPLGSHPNDRISEANPLLGVVARHLEFAAGQQRDIAGAHIVGMGYESAAIFADLQNFPPPERPDLPGGATRDPELALPQSAAAPAGESPDDVSGAGSGAAPVEASAIDRTSAGTKGSLLIFPKIELRWNADGDQLIQDTFVSLVNDYPADVLVQMYYVNGDEPLP